MDSSNTKTRNVSNSPFRDRIGKYVMGATAATAAAGSLSSRAEAVINFTAFNSGPITDMAYVDLENLISASNSQDVNANAIFNYRPACGSLAENIYFCADFQYSSNYVSYSYSGGFYCGGNYHSYSGIFSYIDSGYFAGAELLAGRGGNALTFANVGDAVVDSNQYFYAGGSIFPPAELDNYFVGFRVNIVESDELVSKYGWLEFSKGSFILLNGALNTTGDGIEVGVVPESSHAAAFLAMGAAGLAAFRRKRKATAA